MNNIIKTILERRSYRGKYKQEKIPREHLIEIMEAGLAAPSGCNKQTVSLIAVDDPIVLSGLKAMIDPPVCETAPAIICVLTQKIVAYRDRCFNVQDYSAAIENMLLAINALGYESCWYEGHITDEDDIASNLAKRLNVPEDYSLVCILPVGIAEEPAKRVKKKPFEARAWFNGYKGNGEDKEITNLRIETDKIKLEKVLPNEAEYLHKMKYTAFLPLYDRYHDDETNPVKESIDKVIQQLNDCNTDYYFIALGTERLGAIRIVNDGNENGKNIYRISPIFVLPEYQNKGIGYAVLRKVFDMYGRADLWRLSTIKEEKLNCHLYEKCGFVRVGNEKKINKDMTIVFYEKEVL